MKQNQKLLDVIFVIDYLYKLQELKSADLSNLLFLIYLPALIGDENSGDTGIECENVKFYGCCEFTSKELDEETGLYYFGQRYLDPQVSRWMSADPAFGSYLPTGDNEDNKHLPGQGGIYHPINLNPYCYSGNNPLTYKDPDGKFLLPIVVGYLIIKALFNNNHTNTATNVQQNVKNTSSTNGPGITPVGNVSPNGYFNDDYTNVSASIYTMHEGVDYPVPVGTELQSNVNGTVVSVVNGEKGYGNFVVIQDSDDPSIFYLAAHMSKIDVKKGQKIKPGDIIGKSGKSGGKGDGKMGAHLHTGTYKVKSKEKYNKEGTGFYDADWYINQDNAVDPFNKNIKWKGKLKE